MLATGIEIVAQPMQPNTMMRPLQAQPRVQVCPQHAVGYVVGRRESNHIRFISASPSSVFSFLARFNIFGHLANPFGKPIGGIKYNTKNRS